MKIFKSKKYSGGTEIEDYVFSVSKREAASIERPLEKKRLDFFWWLVLVMLFVLAGRIFYLNIIQGKYYQEIAQGNKIRSITIKAPRGKIFDRFGTPLVNNVASLDAVIVPADFPKDETEKSRIVKELSEILGVNEAEILIKLEGISKRSLNPILIKENISQDESLLLTEKSNEMSGVMIERTAIREYADSSIFSHILGYVGKIEKKELEKNPNYSFTDYIGKDGLESFYEKNLKGTDGAFQVEVDSRGNVKKERGVVNPKPGNDLTLSIDAGLQKKIYDDLSSILEKTETKTAAAVAIDPRSGEVLALVSLPSFDNNIFSRRISQNQYLDLIRNPNKPLFNRAIAGEYPPGSTLKPIVAVAALAEGTIAPETSVGCTGAIHVGSFRFGDWKTHGTMDLRSSIAESCDVYFYSMGGGYGNIAGLGMSRMKKYENNFGLGEKTGIDLFGEGNGFIPDEQWKLEALGEKWYIGNSYHASIGQGFVTATPLQLANSIAAIANGGKVFQPHIVSSINKDNQNIFTSEKKVLHDNSLLQSAIEVVREGMRQTVTAGTAQTLKDLPVEAAGKTGTAQFGSENKTHAWFVSFAPYNNPEIAMAVLVEGGGEGHSSAVPVTRDVYEWYFSQPK
jgi:penicillin-binding protein 2